MSATNRRRGPGDVHAEAVLGIAVTVFVFGGLFTVWAAAAIGAEASGQPAPHGFAPIMCVRLAVGEYAWPGAAATVAVVLLIATYAAIAALVIYKVRRRPDVEVDRAAPYLAQRKDLRNFSTQVVRERARRFGLPNEAAPGVYVGRSVPHGHDIWGSWEDMHVDIWGPRTGKTSTRAIPNIVAAPGACVVTSNKRDIVDATRLSRERHGKVWVFDPQQQANEPATWWWDPLGYVDGSIVRAVKMAGRFTSVVRPEHARADAYFEPAAEELVANYLLAASVAGVPITEVYYWLTRPRDRTAMRILRRGGHDLSADAVEGVCSSPDRQRAGVFGTAQQMLSFLTAPSVTRWVTPGDGPVRPRFDVGEFIREGRDTLYLLSEETNKMAAPLVLALTAALAEGAENTATASPGGRLPTPMLFVLDEAANICPWKALPDKYSHFGSRGIVMMTILQSWAQGTAAWGEGGMAKLWGAANIRVYGGGVFDMKFLSDLSKTSGVFEPETLATSRKSTQLIGGTVNRASRSEPVLDEHDLAAMPRGRMFVQISGAKPVLARSVPWWEGPAAEEVRASLDRYEPSAAEIVPPTTVTATP
ncbi:TraM recognition domain-containing protein [Yinghuangia sp. ASG 101]|uniref:type IV secretory system conjugative DNA transfer family protein n=1 Tax=Yinghuangia sp. ASG 101 TaxID=2896848 RepID=UPI001E4A97AF|nr:TraM recognition domain-containing protein [Yinghuangia sp. ASG 101]UGQ13506.1 TraM recognition domain-containing protein [Yinghuangia sp. ASG 101]